MKRDGLFREEAVRAYLRARDERELLRISPRWLDWAFALLAAAAAAALAFAALVPLDLERVGPARVERAPEDRGRVVALFDAAAAHDLAPGQTLRFTTPLLPPGPPLVVARVERDAARRTVRAEAPLPAASPLFDGLQGTAVVVTGRRTLIATALAELAR
uniref:Uncharacterized protein n=1 Tax=Eiseniibacteriota bacterium TaxID=2212470 RepID=A0A832ICW6_UNCEI